MNNAMSYGSIIAIVTIIPTCLIYQMYMNLAEVEFLVIKLIRDTFWEAGEKFVVECVGIVSFKHLIRTCHLACAEGQ